MSTCSFIGWEYNDNITKYIRIFFYNYILYCCLKSKHTTKIEASSGEKKKTIDFMYVVYITIYNYYLVFSF